MPHLRKKKTPDALLATLPEKRKVLLEEGPLLELSDSSQGGATGIYEKKNRLFLAGRSEMSYLKKLETLYYSYGKSG